MPVRPFSIGESNRSRNRLVSAREEEYRRRFEVLYTIVLSRFSSTSTNLSRQRALPELNWKRERDIGLGIERARTAEARMPAGSEERRAGELEGRAQSRIQRLLPSVFVRENRRNG